MDRWKIVLPRYIRLMDKNLTARQANFFELLDRESLGPLLTIEVSVTVVSHRL